jgi:hypothetical protein
VLRELQTHPDREQIIQQNPNITKRAAHDLKRKQERAAKEKHEEEEEDDWRKHNRRWFKELYTNGQIVSRMIRLMDDLTPEKQRDLLQVIDKEMLMSLGGLGRRLVKFVDQFGALIEEAEQAEPEEVSAPKRVHSAATVHAAE